MKLSIKIPREKLKNCFTFKLGNNDGKTEYTKSEAKSCSSRIISNNFFSVTRVHPVIWPV